MLPISVLAIGCVASPNEDTTSQVSIASSSPSLEDLIIGKWEMTSGGDLPPGSSLIYEFQTDGNAIITRTKSEINPNVKQSQSTKKYEFIDEKRIQLDDGSGRIETNIVTISGKEMAWETNDKYHWKYTFRRTDSLQ